MKFLPSKKIIFLVIFIIVIVAVFAILNRKSEPKSPAGEKKTGNTDVEINDSDNDGLADWEEVLWKTDPNNPDTDSDGTNDGEEIRTGRNPTIAGPDDKMEAGMINSIVPTGEKKSSSFNELNRTQEFAQKFMSQYLLQKSLSGGALSETVKEQIINSTLNETPLELTFKTYGAGDIKTTADNSKERIKAYGNQVGKIIKENQIGINGEEMLTIIKNAVTSGDKSNLGEIENIINKFTKIIEGALKIEVPSNATDLHKEFLNTTSKLTENIIGFYRIFDDPIGGLASTSEFGTVMKDLDSLEKETNSYFEKKGITYQKTDDGYYFLYKYSLF